MRVVVLQCHPLRESYNEALLARTLVGLRAAGSEPELHRLAEVSGPDGEEFDEVDLLVFVHPVWWGGHPAPLLGWVQRQLGPWIDGGEPAATSPLRGVRGLLSVTSHGSSRLINRIQGEPARQLMRRTLLPLCQRGAEHHWTALYKLDRLEPAALTSFLDSVESDAATFASKFTSAVGVA